MYLPWHCCASFWGPIHLCSQLVLGMKTGSGLGIKQGSWLTVGVTLSLSLLHIHSCSSWLNILSSTLLVYLSVLSLGILCSTDHPHNSLWVKPPRLPVQVAGCKGNCRAPFYGGSIASAGLCCFKSSLFPLLLVGQVLWHISYSQT